MDMQRRSHLRRRFHLSTMDATLAHPPPQPGSFGLALYDLNSSAEPLQITADRANRLIAAMNGIGEVLSFEDRFAMLIDNLMAFEEHLFRWALQVMLRPSEGHEAHFLNKRNANRVLGNLLFSTRQYVDQTDKRIQRFVGKPALKAAWSEQYDSSLSYRVIEALRNVIQHKDLGIQSVSAGGGWLGKPGESARRYVISLKLDLDRLAEADFKAATLAELQALPHLPDLKQMVREYVSGLAVAHHRLRTALAPEVQTWRDDISGAIAEFFAAFPKANQQVRTFYIFEARAEGDRSERTVIALEPFDRLQEQQRFNYITLNLGPAYASSEALSPKDG